MTFSEFHTVDTKNESKVEKSSFNGLVTNINAAPASYSPPKGEDRQGGENDVGALIAKSKKAAASLFTLLHAKNCKLGPNMCPHPGCPEAKLMFLHLKTCHSDSGAVCPSSYKGCVDARKLLAHYRRCRDIRSRQAANQIKTNQHVCLVCSLVARNAKTSLDRSRSASPKGTTSRKHTLPSLKQSSNQAPSLQKLSVRPRSVSFSAVARESSFSKESSIPLKTMPPPPPRFFVSNREECKERSRADELQDAMHCALKVERSPEISALDERSPEADELSREFPMPQPRMRRRRSASCHVLSSSNPSSVFDTIQEEPVGEELQNIVDGDK